MRNGTVGERTGAPERETWIRRGSLVSHLPNRDILLLEQQAAIGIADAAFYAGAALVVNSAWKRITLPLGG